MTRSRTLGLSIAALALALAALMLANPLTTPRSPALEAILIWLPFILSGFQYNILMSVLGMALATLLGAVLGFGLISERGWIRLPCYAIMQLFRNSPWLVILFLIMMLMPYQMSMPLIGDFRMADWIKATIALSLPVAANLGEVMRGAIASVHKGQWESAQTLALSHRDILFRVILPQCFRRMIPPWMNWYALLTMSTPITAILGVNEALGNTQAAMESAGSGAGLVLPFYALLLLLFFVVIYPISLWTRRLERRFLSSG